MLTLLDRSFGRRRLVVASSQRSDGDIHPKRVPTPTLAERQGASTGERWSTLDQVHGIDLVEVVQMSADSADWPIRGVGDVQYTDLSDVHVSMWAADCATVFLLSEAGRLVGAHAGWRGLASGVIDVAVAALDGSPAIAAVLGPTIHPCCYEFTAEDRRSVERAVGAVEGELEATTSWGTSALDVPRAVSRALAVHGIVLDVSGPCTGCNDEWFSHRIRNEPGRHATIGWMETLRHQELGRPEPADG